jgi:hypothetical protein
MNKISFPLFLTTPPSNRAYNSPWSKEDLLKAINKIPENNYSFPNILQDIEQYLHFKTKKTKNGKEKKGGGRFFLLSDWVGLLLFLRDAQRYFTKNQKWEYGCLELEDEIFKIYKDIENIYNKDRPVRKHHLVFNWDSLLEKGPEAYIAFSKGAK